MRTLLTQNTIAYLQDPIFGEQFSCTGTEVGYPGGKWFNPFNMASTPEQVREW